ncbi:MAG TPA: hypothetical protein VGK88_14210 [bacterium]|jgi:hypothetical protein
MDSFQVFGVQFAVSLLVYGLIARWYLSPRLAAATLPVALTPLLLQHALRTLGATLLVPGVVGSDVPRGFAEQVAYGDLLAALLALLALWAVRSRWSIALLLVWLFNLEGFIDLLNALYVGIKLDVSHAMLGAAWYIPTFVVPALLVTHLMMFSMLLRRGGELRV